MTSTWPDFYDPDLYEEKIGPGIRVGNVYAELLAGPPLTLVEYGCGTGEILLQLAQEGHRVIGIDRAAAMVDRARQRAQEAPLDIANRISVLHADALEPNLDTQADAVLLTNELVLHILEGELLLKTFAEASRVLKGGGLLYLDLPFVDFAMLAKASTLLGGHEFSRGYFPYADHSSLRVDERVSFDPNTWCKQMIFRYEKIDTNGCSQKVFFRQLEQRVWTLQEISFALEISGFSQIVATTHESLNDRFFVTACKECIS